MSTETDELLLMRWQARPPSPGSMLVQTELFQHGLGIWKTAFYSAFQHGGRVCSERDSMRATAEHRMRQQILQNEGPRVHFSRDATC
jgi:hypothetical protein